MKYTNNITITRRVEFDAAHRVMGHENKCRNLHGHRYVIEASFVSDDLDQLGRVLDFGVIKERLEQWVNQNWDHNVILFEVDKILGENIQQITEQKIYYLPFNPTAENMASYLLEKICPDLFREFAVQCVKIKLYETPNCSAEVIK
jgi:6-pyruvoyltetrahydropterin/6-carboxytetrahydropterin synthase